MTEHEVPELDEQLTECGLTYNARSEVFQTLPRPGSGGRGPVAVASGR